MEKISLNIGNRLVKNENMSVSHELFVMCIECFDALFFGISKSEAKYLDPQQQVWLECTFLSFKDAGYTIKVLRCLNCGVFFVVTVCGSSLARGYQLITSLDKNSRSVYDTILHLNLFL